MNCNSNVVPSLLATATKIEFCKSVFVKTIFVLLIKLSSFLKENVISFFKIHNQEKKNCFLKPFAINHKYAMDENPLKIHLPMSFRMLFLRIKK